MPDITELLKQVAGADADITPILEAMQAEADAIANQKTLGLVKKKEELLGTINRLKKSQLPEGVDIDAYNQFLDEKETMAQEQARLEEERLAASGEWDRLKNGMVETHTTELNTLKSTFEQQNAQLKNALDKELIENVLIKAIDKEQGNAQLLLPHLKPHLQTMLTEAGRFETMVMDNTGNPRINTSTGEAFKVADLVAEVKANPIFQPAFQPTNSGSGMGTGQPNAGNMNGAENPFRKETWNLTKQGQMRKENKPLADQMAKAAGREVL